MQILVADDMPMVRRLCTSILRGAGHKVLEAEDGAMALEQYAEHRPDAILLDLRMPNMDGLAVLRELKVRDPAARVVIVTAGTDAEILGLLVSMAVATMVGAERARLEGVLLAARTAEHELNNQLAIAAGYASLLVDDPDLPQHLCPLAQDVVDGALEASRLVDEIRRIKRLDLVEGSVPNGNVINLERSVA